MALTVLPGYQRNTGSSYDFSGTFAQDNSFGSSLQYQSRWTFRFLYQLSIRTLSFKPLKH
jgi:hypothetical protein